MILVTGGTGLVGSHLLYYLSQKNDRIRASFRTEDKLETVKHVFSYYSENPDELFSKIEWIKCTLNDLPKLTQAFENVTQVYHCAAMVSFDPNDYHQLRNINIKGTANIVNLCIANSIEKICYVSSIAAIGESETSSIITEDEPWNSDADHNVYAITKYGAELEVWRGTQEGVDAVIVNPGIIIGPGYWRSSSGSLFKRIYKGLKHYTTGISGYVDIHDVVKSMILLMSSDIKNERYILVAENWSFKDFSNKVANELGVPPPKKGATKFQLEVAWRLDWLNYFFKRKYRKLPKQLARSILKERNFSNEKIKLDLNFKFKDVNTSIEETSPFFLKDQGL
ncbi:MAG: NAD-dependent epimerase/dehydratase family protein [Bacteroidia bacterium]|nr:NAD-dependent epimerase/dehydratase family protein [Bacteroidia bacterium]NND51235.1 NAD-dependent epimerase/dehydratase family protein [Flavobacteriaceae bacterium]